MSGKVKHSQAHLGDHRKYWWNDDYLDLLVSRLAATPADVLDIGCGLGHWGDQIFSRWAPAARRLALDSEPSWLAEHRNRNPRVIDRPGPGSPRLHSRPGPSPELTSPSRPRRSPVPGGTGRHGVSAAGRRADAFPGMRHSRMRPAKLLGDLEGPQRR